MLCLTMNIDDVVFVADEALLLKRIRDGVCLFVVMPARRVVRLRFEESTKVAGVEVIPYRLETFGMIRVGFDGPREIPIIRANARLDRRRPPNKRYREGGRRLPRF